MTAEILMNNNGLHAVIRDSRVKSFKIVKNADGTRKLICYQESWDDLQRTIGSKVSWDGQSFC